MARPPFLPMTRFLCGCSRHFARYHSTHKGANFCFIYGDWRGPGGCAGGNEPRPHCRQSVGLERSRPVRGESRRRRQPPHSQPPRAFVPLANNPGDGCAAGADRTVDSSRASRNLVAQPVAPVGIPRRGLRRAPYVAGRGASPSAASAPHFVATEEPAGVAAGYPLVCLEASPRGHRARLAAALDSSA